MYMIKNIEYKQFHNFTPSWISTFFNLALFNKIFYVCLLNRAVVTISYVDTYTLTAVYAKNEGICHRQYRPVKYMEPTSTHISLTIVGFFDFVRNIAFFIIR